MKKLIKNFNISIVRQAIKLMGKESKIFMAFIYGFCLIELCCTILSAIGTKGVINAITQMNMKRFWLPMSFIIIKNLIWWVYAPISSRVTARISKKALCDIKTNLVEHIIKLPMSYHDRKPTGELLSILSNDVRCLSDVYDWTLFQVLRSAIGGIGGLIVMAVIDVRFAIVVFSLGAISVYISAYYSKRLEQVGREQQESLAKTTTDAYELVRASKTIRLFNLEREKEESFINTAQSEADIKINNGKLVAKMNATITIVNMLTYTGILSIGALFVYFGLSEWGTVIALIGLKDITDMIFIELGQFMAEMQTNIVGIKRILEIMELEEESTDNSCTESKTSENSLVMENINFSYDGNNQILSEFNLVLRSRSLTALVGESGSGKSTIMKLILGMYMPEGGSISFNNSQNIYTSLREAASYVPQEPILFRGTILDNILLGNPEATKEKVISAAKIAGADEFIVKLTNGYDTEILDNGQSLSGGQKQRIAIARAILKDAPILLLDEITSSLDQEMEAQIINTIKQISKSKAVLFITHNPSAHIWADEIIKI